MRLGVWLGVALLFAFVPGSAMASPRPVITSAKVDARGHLVVTWTKAATDNSIFVVWSQYPDTEPTGDGFPCGPGAEPFLYRAHRDPLGGFPAVSASATSYRSPSPLEGAGTRYVQVIAEPTIPHEDPERPGHFTTICGHFSDPVAFEIPEKSGASLAFMIPRTMVAYVGERFAIPLCRKGEPRDRRGVPRNRLCGPPSNPGTAPWWPRGGTPPYTFNLKIGGGFLPKGLVLNHNTGWIEGTPERTTAGRTYKFTVCVRDSVGATSCDLAWIEVRRRRR